MDKTYFKSLHSCFGGVHDIKNFNEPLNSENIFMNDSSLIDWLLH